MDQAVGEQRGWGRGEGEGEQWESSEGGGEGEGEQWESSEGGGKGEGEQWESSEESPTGASKFPTLLQVLRAKLILEIWGLEVCRVSRACPTLILSSTRGEVIFPPNTPFPPSLPHTQRHLGLHTDVANTARAAARWRYIEMTTKFIVLASNAKYALIFVSSTNLTGRAQSRPFTSPQLTCAHRGFPPSGADARVNTRQAPQPTHTRAGDLSPVTGSVCYTLYSPTERVKVQNLVLGPLKFLSPVTGCVSHTAQSCSEGAGSRDSSLDTQVVSLVVPIESRVELPARGVREQQALGHRDPPQGLEASALQGQPLSPPTPTHNISPRKLARFNFRASPSRCLLHLTDDLAHREIGRRLADGTAWGRHVPPERRGGNKLRIPGGKKKTINRKRPRTPALEPGHRHRGSQTDFCSVEGQLHTSGGHN
ncbi:hypothetical protein RRG08_038236 [Elysia crispata]|uniref:Uncharacterized protein n=1 Tax=Elysia crispata TaxID=231223 RepID=A0AAE1AMP7_9GAST|nr:hypothetical protein RRG08_038236 [Elysia crispata]